MKTLWIYPVQSVFLECGFREAAAARKTSHSERTHVGDHERVHKVNQEGADNRHDEPGAGRRTILFADRLHVREAVHRSAHAETDAAHSEHHVVVLLAEELDEDEPGKGKHQHSLGRENHDHRNREIHEFVELQRVDRHRDEEDQADVSDSVESLAFNREGVGEVTDVADDSGHDHGADIGGERDVLTEVARNHSAERHAERDDGAGLHW